MNIVEYAEKFIGRPYIWGGDGTGKTSGGFDCSGFVLECLLAVGKYRGGDTTAQGLRNFCKNNGVGIEHQFERPGDLVFFGSKVNNRASHVAIAIGDGLMIEAGGGGSKCTTTATSTGMVRVRPISSRSDLLEVWSL